MLAAPAPAPALPAVKVQSAWVASARPTRVAALSLSGIPPAAHVVLRCGGGGCPFRSKAVATHGAGRLSLTRAFRHVRLRVGARLDLRVSDSTGALVVRFVVRSGKTPTKERTWVSLQGAPAPAPGAPAPVPGAPGEPAAGAGAGHHRCRAGAPVARADLLPGDVVCFDDGTGYLGHVGLYAGDDRFLHAPHTGAVIGYNALSEPYYSARFAGGRRYG